MLILIIVIVIILCLLSSLVAAGENPDWLVASVKKAVRAEERDGEVALSNGLISRTFRTAPNLATIDYRNLTAGVGILRGVKPEAVLVIDGRRAEVGGLKGQPDYAYLDPAWIGKMTSSPEAFQYAGCTIGEPAARYPWKPKRRSEKRPWPPAGLSLTFRFRPPESWLPLYDGLAVSVHYEMYEGMPVLSKWLSIENRSGREILLESVVGEILAVTEQEKQRLHVESDYVFDGMDTTHWGPDPDYKTQIDFLYRMPLLMTSKDPLGPGVALRPGERFDSFRTFELLHDSDDRERRGLGRRRMVRALAPQVTENPILMHVRSSDSVSVRRAVDQCAEVGFDMVILTFWSGFDIESEDPDCIVRFKADVDYAHRKGIEIGGYTLMCASRDAGPENNCISPETGQPGSKFGQSACLASEWADSYFRRVLDFMDKTGMDVIETDGPFHGDVCASTEYKHHRGLKDSQLRQWQACVNFYHECRKRGIYINSPDSYYLNGSNKCGMGYREDNFSLPRWRQILIARQNIYDGTFEKAPSMGWMFVPLVEYHGGGEAATFEPLSAHLKEYEWHLAQNFGSGVQACYRGPRLFDTKETRAVVKKWVSFYKKHRLILDSDIIHVRRPDGRSIDCVLHVNSRLKERGLAMFYNPTDRELKQTIRLPLYYTGLTDRASVRFDGGRIKEYILDREYHIQAPVRLGPKEITWLVVE
ncbi:MAG: alpha-galactosidase [Armatimonadetes bacterium]|nr:alpha-galactosidase [Armatimonadota bacterium]